MFQESEIINIILALISILMFAFVFKKMGLPKLPLLYIGFIFMLCGYLFTVIEGVIWYKFFNLLEHLCYAVSGILFAAGCFSIIRHSTSEQAKKYV
ncbi:MAG: hypothetical protein MUO43_06595 [Desulfobacterales bacterium]|nr:hypothetical protein [Desulfobacterales bacterium]